MERTLGILLAGGQGRRLGLSRPKALVTLAGATLLERGCATLAGVCEKVVVVAPAEMELALPVGIRRLMDSGAGPLGGIAAAGAVDFERACVLGVDFPLAAPATLVALLDHLRKHAAVVPAPGGRPQPLVAAYARRAITTLAAVFERGERSVIRALKRLAPRILDDREIAALPGGPKSFFDIDTPDDLAEAERLLRAGGPPVTGAAREGGRS